MARRRRQQRRGSKRKNRGSRILNNINFLQSIHRARRNKKAQKQVLGHCTGPEVCTIGEVAKNVLKGTIPLKPKQKRALCKYKRAIRALASRQVNSRTKSKLIRGRWLGTTVALVSSVLPWIIDKIRKSRKK